VLDYWQAEIAGRHNGIFAAARIGDAGASLRFTTDAFGIAPLYWRQLRGGLILFGTSPRYLRIAADTVSRYAERLFMHRHALAGNASLIDGVERVSPGTVLSFTAEQRSSVRWFDFSTIPRGDEEFSDSHVVDAELAFQTAMDRCLNLMPNDTSSLPLSSGDDSRRILASLTARGSPFRAMTVRVLQKGNRDLDARFASEMAAQFGFGHDVFEVADPLQYGKDDAACRLLFSSELSEHSWIAPLVRALPPGPSLVFDGLGGDIFGNTGYARRELYETQGDGDLIGVVRLSTSETINALLRDEAWESLTAVRDRMVKDLAFLPRNRNRPDLAFLLIRARRGTGPCMQNLLPPGQLPVYPYFDLDHVIATLRSNPIAKLEQTLQARCLARFWPDFFSVPGSRRFSTEIPRHSDATERARLKSRMRHLAREAQSRGISEAFRRMRFRNASLAALGVLSDRFMLRSAWWLAPLLVLEAFRSHAAVCDVE
jgi:hypothetical protein